MAENARPAGAVLPTGASPEQQAVNRRLLSQAQGKGGQFFGSSWRAFEAPYPSDGPTCLHFQIRTSGGWRTVLVLSPDAAPTYIPP